MMEHAMIPLGFTSLPDIRDVEPLSADDYACISEVRDVLERHEKLDRFGVALLHAHFPVEEEEVLVEECDPKQRVLTTRPVRKEERDKIATIETIWQLGTGHATLGCRVECSYDWVSNRHSTRHRRA